MNRLPRPTPLQALLEERLRSARGLGWDMGAWPACGSREGAPNPSQPPLSPHGGIFKGEGKAEGAPAWFRITYLTLRSLGLVRG